MFFFSVPALGLMGGGGDARAQDMEPRAYSASPGDTNFSDCKLSRTTGAVSLDPSLPIANVKASINGGLLAYDRTFGLLGQTGSAAIVIPYSQGEISGDVFDARKQVSRTGLHDMRVRITENLIGKPAHSVGELK